MKFKSDPEIISITILCVLVALASQNILTPYSNFIKSFQSLNGVPFSNIDLDEYNSAKFLSDITDIGKNPNAYVISDYATSYIFRGMTGMNTSANRSPSMTINNWINMQLDIKHLFSQSLNNTAFKNLNKITYETHASNVYLVLSKRTCWSLNQAGLEIIRHLPLPKVYTFEAYCSFIAEKFDSSPLFHRIYKNDGIRIYEYLKNASKI